jgi:peptidoglycan-associated lipoprotein
MNSRKLIALAPCLVALIAGCSSAPKNMTAAAPAPIEHVARAPARQQAQATPAPAPAAQATRLAAYLDPHNPISTERSVYFDFDDYAIKSDYNNLIEMQGKFLADHPGLAIKVEGNADERGSAEYNLALGQKRAEAVVRALKIVGVQDKQLEAISWGKEKPKALGHDDADYALNRRADLAYPVK